MEPIELELWKLDPEDPRYLKYAGQPKAEEVFQKLGRRLEAVGLIPDEYFLLLLRRELLGAGARRVPDPRHANALRLLCAGYVYRCRQRHHGKRKP